jgi:hypothetical protein
VLTEILRPGPSALPALCDSPERDSPEPLVAGVANAIAGHAGENEHDPVCGLWAARQILAVDGALDHSQIDSVEDDVIPVRLA